jgi:site-specific recombinase XerD
MSEGVSLSKKGNIMEKVKYKDGSIGYKEKVYLPNGTRITKTFERKTDAIKWKRQNEVLKQQGDFDLIAVNQKVLFLEVADKWLNQKVKASCGHKTFYEYKSQINKHFKDRFQNRFITQLTTSDVYSMVNDMKVKGLKPKTINKMICNLKQVYKYAFKEKIIRQNQMSEINLLPEPERDFDFFDKSEIQNILTAAKGTQMHSIVVVALNTGMRIGEIFGLKWDKIDLNNKTITISRKMTRQGLQDHTKSKRIRRIGINDHLNFELRKLKQSSKSDYVFTDKNNDPISPDHFSSRKFSIFLAEAKIRSLRFHDLRHTFASHFVMNGGSIYQLQHVLGHSETSMTSKYAHLSESHLVEAASTVGFSAENIKKDADSPDLALDENVENYYP